MYNPNTDILTVGITGNAATATISTKATQDAKWKM